MPTAAKKTTARRKVAGKKVTKKTTAKKKTAKKSEGKRGPSIRVRVFEALYKAGNEGLTGRELKEALSLGGVPSLLKDEGMSSKPRIKRNDIEGRRGAVYVLTAAGRKAHEAGKVDENVPERTSGKDWK